MRYFISTLLVFIITTSSVKAQSEEGTYDLLKLTDGSVLKGEVIDQDSESITIVSSILDTVKVHIKRIATVVYNTDDTEQESLYVRGNRIRRTRPPKYYKESGYFAALDLGFVSGADPGTHLNLTLGKRVKPELYLGVQGGIESVTITNPLIWLVQDVWAVGAYGRYYPMKTKLRPFLSARVGYGVTSDESSTAGMNYAPGIGLHFKSRRAVRFYMAITQHFQKIDGRSSVFIGQFDMPDVITYDLWINRSVIKFGIEF